MVLKSLTDETLGQRVRRRIGWAIRDLAPNRKVVRDVQGVRLTLPWSHRLPDYAKVSPEYGQNLVGLAALLKVDDRPVGVIDVGANVGDSALQILAATDARVLCVEADAYFLEFLELNLGSDARAAIEPSLLTVGADDDGSAKAPVRAAGTTRFEPGESAETLPSVSIDELRRRHPDFAGTRLVKSDTDGYDVVLVPALAEAWAESRPVLFFEYDHALSRVAGNDPLAVWTALAALGYTSVAVWDNGGRPLGQLPIYEVAAAASVLDTPIGPRAQHFWDVAVVHGKDEAGLNAINTLAPTAFAAPRLP